MSKTVIITGTGSGIGKETALLCARKNWNVVATMRHPEQRTTGLENVKNIELYHLDVLDKQSIKDCIAHCRKKYGKIDAMVNNAGYALMGIFEASTDEQIKKQYATNVFGVMDVVKGILPVFREQKDGTLVNLASVGGRCGFPMYSIYQGTKWAVDGFSEALAYELEPLHIRVKIVEPGVVKTDFYNRSMDKTVIDSLTDYDSFVKQINDKASSLENNGSEASRIARVVYKAIVSRSKRLRYLAGPDAHLLFLLRRILPFGLFRNIVKGVSM